MTATAVRVAVLAKGVGGEKPRDVAHGKRGREREM
jgi:hypothetical protein